jgi:hypothetical protein
LTDPQPATAAVRSGAHRRLDGVAVRLRTPTLQEKSMRKITPALLACVALAGNAFAADEMKSADGMMKKETPMTMQECKDHMAMAKKDGMKKDDAMMKKDAMCADMMKKDDAMMKKDAMTKKEEPMKK